MEIFYSNIFLNTGTLKTEVNVSFTSKCTSQFLSLSEELILFMQVNGDNLKQSYYLHFFGSLIFSLN